MKVFTTFIKKIKTNKYIGFALSVLGFYILLMIIYLYLMYGNLSTAPQFVYSQF